MLMLSAFVRWHNETLSVVATRRSALAGLGQRRPHRSFDLVKVKAFLIDVHVPGRSAEATSPSSRRPATKPNVRI